MTVPPSRVVVVGAGAIGASVGGLLHLAGVPVTLVARGAQADALRARGLDLRTPRGARLVPVPIADASALPTLGPDALVILATMGQAGAGPLAGLDRRVPVASFQNGTAPLDALVDAGFPTLAAMVYVPAERRGPGVVALAGEPHPGAILVGPWRAPSALRPPLDALATWLAGQLAAAGFRAEPEPDVAPWIRAKLLVNLGGILAALVDDPVPDVLTAAQAEAIAVYAAAREGTRTVDELLARVGPLTTLPVDGVPRVGGSTRHALARIHAGLDAGPLETAALHGPIVARGERLGVPTPVNAVLIALAERAAAERWRPGCLSAGDVREAVGRGG